jgi:hypothetical protein
MGRVVPSIDTEVEVSVRQPIRLRMSRDEAARLIERCLDDGYVVLAERPGVMPTERLTSPGELPGDATEILVLPPEPVPDAGRRLPFRFWFRRRALG